MTWFVRYVQGSEEHIARLHSPELAIEAACRLMDEGREVVGIGSGELTDSVDKDVIARIYELWTRGRPRRQQSTNSR